MEALAILGAIILVPAFYVLVTYNSLVRLRNHCDEAWSNIDTELKRRYNLIPNLVNTVKGYATHERELLEEVTRLRQVCVEDHGTPQHQAQTENQFIRALGPLIARLENYPDLKANQNYLDLQQELANTENRIQAARRFYNGNVRENNNKVEMFPSSLVANAMDFPKKEFFEIEELAAREVPQVKLGN